MAVPFCTEVPVKTMFLQAESGSAEPSAPSTTVMAALFSTASLAGECGLDHKQVARGDDAGIGRHHVAGREADHIAGDELIEGDFDALAVAQGAAGVGDRVLEGLGSIAAAGFLDKLHAARYQQHDADDDDRGGSRCGSGTASTSI